MLIGGVVLALLFAFVAVAAHDLIERLWLERVLGGALGGDASIATLRHVDDRTYLDGVRITTGGGVAISADSVTYRAAGDVWDVQPTGVQATVTVDRLAGDEAARFVAAAQGLGIARLHLTLRDASLNVGRSTDVTPAVEITGISGTVATGSAAAFDLSGDLIDATGAYPFVAHAATDAAGAFAQTWHADALPLAPFGALLANPAFDVSAGVARDVTAGGTRGLRATLQLDGVRARIAGIDVHELHGPLTIVPDGAGSGGLDALAGDGIPVAAAGEVHDVHDWVRALGEGTRDSRALARMFALIAVQPNVRWMNVETTAPGITFGQYAMTNALPVPLTPHVIQLLAVDPHEPTVHFDTALSSDHVISTGERTSDLGVRTNAVAGVNGDYFDIGRTYEPQGLLIRSGTLLHGPTDHEAAIFDRNNTLTFALFHLHGAARSRGRVYPITLYNSWPTREGAIITPDYGAVLPAAPGVTFVALAPVAGNAYRVTSVRAMTEPLPVTFGIGIGSAVHAPLPRPGDLVDLQYALDPPVAGAFAGIGSGPLLLRDGAWYEDLHAPAPDERNVRWPVVAVGTMADGTILFASVDGRHPERSIGMTRPEFADLLRGYGVTDAMALDSGGSVTMVSRAPGNTAVTVRNAPSDNSAERYVTDALFVYSSAPLGTIVTAPRPHVEPTPLAEISR